MLQRQGLPGDSAPETGDPRVRRYIAPQRIVCCEGMIRDGELLLNSTEIQSYAYTDMEVCRLYPGSSIVLDFGRELPGGVRLVTSPNALQVSLIQLTFGESVSEALGCPDNDHAIHQTLLRLPPTGMTEYGNTGFRFLRIQVPGEAERPVEMISVFAVALFRDLEYTGKFQCSDERLNRIWDVGAYTVHLCMQDFLYDGIKRDRMIWIGDVYPETRTILAVFDDTDCVEKTLNFPLNHTPDGRWINDTSAYAAWWVICHYEWFWRRGRLKYLESAADPLRKVLRMLAECIDASGTEHLPEVRFLDWPSRNDPDATRAGLQGLLSWCFECGRRLAEFLRDGELEKLCADVRRRLLKAPIPRTGNKSAAAMLALGGCETPGEWHLRALSDAPTSGISTFGGYFVLEARAAAGDLAGALRLIRDYWGAMLDLGATTFWEDFDLAWAESASPVDRAPEPGKADIHRDFGRFCYRGLRRSLCHGWAGGPTAFLSEHILGVRAAAPGFSKAVIAPDAAGLAEFSGAMPTPFGPIEVEGGGGKWLCRVPEGVEVLNPDRKNIFIKHS